MRFIMQTMPVTEFKAHATEVLSNVAKTKAPVVITKRGVSFAQVIPFQVKKENVKNIPGRLADTVLFEDDVVSPLNNEWDASL